MANYNISTTGIRTTGPSTVDDWTDANCYNASNFTSIAEANTDTFVFDAGSYAMAAQWTLTSGITASLRGNGDAILVGAAVGYVVQTSAGSGETVTLNGIKLDATNSTVGAINMANRTAAYTTTLEDIEITNGAPSYTILVGHRRGTINFTNITLSGTYPGQFIQSSASLAETANLTINIDGVHFDNVIGTGASTSHLIALTKGDYATTLTGSIKNVTGVIDKTGYGTIYGIICSGFDDIVVEDNDFTVITDNVGGSFGISVYGTDAINRQTDNPIFRNNNVNFYCPAGDAISVGRDAETGLGWTTNALAHDNTMQGINSTAYSPHGFVFRGLSSGKAYNNRMKRFHSPMMLSLCTSDNVMQYGNLITDVYGVALSLKGNSGGLQHNNTAIITPNSIDGATTKPKGIWAREQGATANSASKTYNNNIIYLGMIATSMFAEVGVGDANTFSNNNYYTDQVIPADAWNYTGTTYATLALWNAAQETFDATDNANFTATIAEIVAAFGNLTPDELSANAATNGGGLKWWTGANPDTLNEPLSSFDIDQGLQSKNGDFHPTNL